MIKREYRSELRVDGEGNARKLVGHAAVYDQDSEVLGGWFIETVRAGAFSETIQDDIRCLFNHDPNYVLGRTKAKTLRLFDEPRGLRIECDAPDTQVSRDLMTSIARRDIDGMSFAFEILEDRWTFSREAGKPSRRELLKVKLYDVAPVTFPAYPQTDVSVRAGDAEANRRTFEDAARRHGFDPLQLERARLALAEAELDLG